jgi:site-specific DNA recombinase
MDHTTPRLAATYCRVSTDEQRDRQTIENQVELTRAYCASKGLTLSAEYRDDGVTGTIPLVDRPAGRQLVEAAQRGEFDTVVVKQVDRLGRDARYILNAVHHLESLGVRVESAHENIDLSTPQGKFMLTMYSGVAALERDTIVERSVAGTNRLAREGAWLGGIVPYGYRVCGRGKDARLVPSDEPIGTTGFTESTMIQRIFQMLAEEGESCYSIADWLNSLGIPPTYSRDDRQVLRGKRKVTTSGIWRPSRVRNLIVSETYKGIHRYGQRSRREREVIEREVPALVSADLWERARQALRRNQRFSRKNAVHQYLLRGLIKCGMCDLTYSGTSTKRRNGFQTYYVCNGKKQARGLYGLAGKRCPSHALNGDIERIVWQDVEIFLRNPGDVIEQLEAQLFQASETQGEVEAEMRAVQHEIQAKDDERDAVITLWRRQRIDTARLDRQLEQIDAEEKALRARLSVIENRRQAASNAQKHVVTAQELLASLRARLDQPMSWDLQRKLVEALVQEVRVHPRDDSSAGPTVTVTYRFHDAVSCTDRDSWLPPA